MRPISCQIGPPESLIRSTCPDPSTIGLCHLSLSCWIGTFVNDELLNFLHSQLKLSCTPPSTTNDHHPPTWPLCCNSRWPTQPPLAQRPAVVSPTVSPPPSPIRNGSTPSTAQLRNILLASPPSNLNTSYPNHPPPLCRQKLLTMMQRRDVRIQPPTRLLPTPTLALRVGEKRGRS